VSDHLSAVEARCANLMFEAGLTQQILLSLEGWSGLSSHQLRDSARRWTSETGLGSGASGSDSAAQPVRERRRDRV
jgi:hypothetical protein